MLVWRCIYYTTTENEIQYHTVSTGECRKLIRLRRCSLWEFAEIRFVKFHVFNPLYGYGIEYTVGRGIYYITTKRTVGDDVLGVPPSHIYYTTTKSGTQYHTVSTFIIFFYGNIVTQDPFFPAHAAEAITFVYSDKSNQNRRKRTGRPLDSAFLNGGRSSDE